jgi:hypothetical protein
MRTLLSLQALQVEAQALRLRAIEAQQRLEAAAKEYQRLLTALREQYAPAAAT